MMIKIYTFAHKRPDFLPLQLKSFRKNLTEEFEFIIFNNAVFDKDRSHYQEILDFCRKNNLKCIDIQCDPDLVNQIKLNYNESVFNNQNEYLNAVIACAYPLCFAWKHILSKNNDKICIIDSDMFFVQKDNISETLDKYDLVFLEQSRDNNVHYMWNGFVLMNLANLPDKSKLSWWCGYCENQPVDCGGQTFYYLRQYSNRLKIGKLLQYYTGEDPNCNFIPANYEHFSFGENKSILHYRGGSNWDHKTPDYHDKKTQWLKAVLNE